MGLVDTIRALRTSPKKDPLATSVAAVTANGSQVGKANVQLFRRWARGSEWVRAAINIRNNQIATAEWDIVPVDENKRWSKRLQAQLQELFDSPNDEDRNFPTFAMKIVEDILTLDAGVIEKDRSLDGVVRRMWPVDGGKVKVNALWDGDPKEPRFYWYPLYYGDPKDAVPFRASDMAYIMANPVSYLPIGIAPLETLKYAVDAMLMGDEYNVRQIRGAAPDGMIDLGEGAGDKQVAAFRSYWMSEVAGKGAMAFVGGTKGAKFHQFRQSNRDMQFLEFQVWYVRKVAAVFNMSPQDLGLTMDINRANAEQQAEQSEDRGQRPLMALVQEAMTREIVWDAGFGGRDNNLAFRFKRLNLKESLTKAQINEIALGGAAWKTVDEARIDDGRPPIGGKLGSSLLMRLSNGVVRLDDSVPTAGDLLKLQEKAAEQPAALPELPTDGHRPSRRRQPSQMLDDITFAAAAWNEERRAPRLLRLAKRHFSHIVLAVQASSDRTLEIARSILDRPTDVILEHPHMGAGDFSLHQIVRHVETPWTLVISLDEMPSPALLSSLPEAIEAAVEQKADGIWLPFRSKIEDIEYDEQHGHVRLYRSHLRWPNKLHSAPPTRRDLVWQHGYIRHDRSLDEMVTDYLRYYRIGRGDRGWDRHNLMMMREACRSIAAKHGWQYVTAYGWWPEVRKEAFGDEDPWQSTGTRGEPTTTP